jgi:hypothetical protein
MTILVTGKHFFRLTFGTSGVFPLGTDLSAETILLVRTRSRRRKC